MGADYGTWNRAWIRWATQGVPHDTPVYLSVDDRTVASLGLGSVADFSQAVRARVVKGDRVDLSDLQDDGSDNPAGVAFLVLLVLAANDMMGDDEVDVQDFFTHFCRRLGVPGEDRPLGMKTGEEERLWKDWNKWLASRGWIATAMPGQGSRRFVNYPISQALLREADEQALCRVFVREKWTASRSETSLLADLTSQKQLNQHLSRLLDDHSRREVLGAEVQAVHQAWLAGGCPEPQRFSRQARNPDLLWAGLYRTEDRWGNPEYYLYPKAPRHWAMESVTVEGWGTLKLERAGWFYPVGTPLSPEDASQGRSWPIQAPNYLQRLQLPSQNFWVLVPDPENPEASACASWGRPKLGSAFTLLFREALWPDLQRLQTEKLLQWSGDREAAFAGCTDWWEVRHVQVLAPVWDGLFLRHPDLKEALQPCDRLQISFFGGLRVPHGRGWLMGYLPEVTVFGFQPSVEVSLEEVGTGRVCLAPHNRSTNQPWALPENLTTGTYRVKVRSGRTLRERWLVVMPWHELLLANLDRGQNNDRGDRPIEA